MDALLLRRAEISCAMRVMVLGEGGPWRPDYIMIRQCGAVPTTSTARSVSPTMCLSRLVVGGAIDVHLPGERLGGAGFAVLHPDGTVIEYVHHRPSDSEG
jgi:hypothetical protein